MICIPDWLNPWRANRELRSEIARLLAQNHLLDHALHQSNERYDRIRDANAELRSALALYRGNSVVRQVEIEWLSDSTDCDQAGCSGGYAQGARVTLDGEPLAEMIPLASCFGSDHDWDTDQVYTRILQALGYQVRTRYGD